MTVIIFAIIAIITLIIGWKREFFSFPSPFAWFFSIRWFQVSGAFFFYFLFSTVISPMIGKWVQKAIITKSTHALISYAAWVNFLNSTAILICLLVLIFFIPVLRKNIWGRQTPNLFHDLTTAFSAWVISFPLIVFVNQALDWIVTHIFHMASSPEQLAVQFLKMTFGYPVLFILALLSIVVLAPLVEEILFRGFLQSFIRQHLGRGQAILITSLLFALYHYSPEQKMSNLTIVGSLFIFSLFLGFVYEKRGSLFASIALHSIFNAFNVINLYFLGKTL